MVTLVVLTFLSAAGVSRLAPRRRLWAWLGPLLAVILLLLFGFEVVVRGTQLFVSDENFYLDQGRNAALTNTSDRYVWVLLNALILRFDWGLSGLPLKLVNIPFLAVFVALLWRIFDRDRLVWWLPVILPYVAYMATLNLRDMLILTVTAACVYFWDSRNALQRLLFMPAIAVLYLTRPAIAVASGVVWLGILAASGFRRTLRGRIPVKAVLIIGGSLVLFGVIFADPIVDRLQRYLVWFQYALGRGFAERALERGLDPSFVSGSWPERIAIGGARYALAPLPSSLLMRSLQGGSEQWGLVDDIVRMLHQTSYYLLLGFLVIRWRWWLLAARSLTRGQTMLLAAFILYFPAYSIYHFGLSHQRVKLPFQIAVFLFALIVHRTRRSYGQPTHPYGPQDHGA